MRTLALSVCLAAAVLLAGCEPAHEATVPAAVAGTLPTAQGEGERTREAAQLIVHKTPTCGCCLAWADQMQAAGFAVQVRDVQDLAPIKQRLGVPPQSASCHTAEVGGYFVEGHVPAADIRRLLAEKPDARGLAVPGMPIGSPGMEHPSGMQQSYEVLLVKQDGSTEVFATHP